MFGHGAAVAYHNGAGWVCIDPLELSTSVHDVKIAVLGAVYTRSRHRPVAVRIHGIGAIETYGKLVEVHCPSSPILLRYLPVTVLPVRRVAVVSANQITRIPCRAVFVL